MRPDPIDHRPSRRRRSGRDATVRPPDSEPWPTHRVVAESARVFRRLQQLEARPWWRVSARELDEIDARLDVLRAHADVPRG